MTPPLIFSFFPIPSYFLPIFFPLIFSFFPIPSYFLPIFFLLNLYPLSLFAPSTYPHSFLPPHFPDPPFFPPFSSPRIPSSAYATPHWPTYSSDHNFSLSGNPGWPISLYPVFRRPTLSANKLLSKGWNPEDGNSGLLGKYFGSLFGFLGVAWSRVPNCWNRNIFPGLLCAGFFCLGCPENRIGLLFWKGFQ